MEVVDSAKESVAEALTFENMYFALLGAAEDFRISKNPDIRKSIHCLEAILTLNPPARVEVRTRFQIAQLMWLHTKNIDHARDHLKKALSKVKDLTSMEELKLEITSLLASVYMAKHKNNEAVKLLNNTIELAINYQFWYCQMCFQLAKANMDLGKISAAVTTLAAGAEYAGRINAQNTRLLFSLSQAMALLVQRNFDVADVILKEVGAILENAEQSGLALTSTEILSLKVFHHVLQVSEYIWQGLIKSARQSLKQLHSCYKQLTQLDANNVASTSNTAEMFHWMNTQQLFLLVYVVSVMHALQQGYTDKAESYAKKALHLIDKQRTYNNDSLLSSYQIILLEQLVLTHLLKGSTSGAIKELQKCTAVYQKHHHTLKHHRASLHTALGLYAMALPDSLDNALAQFNAALKYTAEPEQVAFIKLNSAIVHIKQDLPPEQLNSLLESIEPGKMPNKCHSLKASSYCIQGLAALVEGRMKDAKSKLRETLVMANKADLNKLTSCAFVLLGDIFLKMDNNRDAIEMVRSAHDIANRIPDVGLQVWSAQLLSSLYEKTGDAARAEEYETVRQKISQTTSADVELTVNSTEHCLLQWLDSEFPPSSMSMV